MGSNHWSKVVMSPLECAYVAGFFDGEGSLYCMKVAGENRSGFKIFVQGSISQTSLPVLEYIQTISGNGRISMTKKKHENHKDVWCLRWQPNQLRHIVPQLLPYLIVKRNVAEKMLKLLELKEGCPTYSKNNQQEQFALYNEISFLNKRGITPSTIEFNGLSEAKRKSPYARTHKNRKCETAECDRKHYAKGMCFNHYREANPKIYNKPKPPKGVRGRMQCLECGTEFEYFKKTPKYCSKICRQRFNKKIERERRIKQFGRSAQKRLFPNHLHRILMAGTLVREAL